MPEAKKEEEFGVTDHSATAPFLKKLISEQVIKVLPAAYSPNALTLTGGFLAACSCLIIWVFMGDMRAGTESGKLWMISSALLLIFYGVFDQLDGMQARKTGRSSPFGDFLDHWVDTIIANSMTLPFMIMLEVDMWMIWLMVFVTALAFWAHNWETRNINYRHLPLVGGLESIWTGLTIMTITAVFGIEVWRESWQGISLMQLFYWLGLTALVWVVVRSLFTSRTRVSDYLGFLIALMPLSLWLLFMAPKYEDSLLFICLGYVSFGMMATLLTGNLMRHQWLGGIYRQYDLLIPLMGLGMIFVSFIDIDSGVMSIYQQSLILAVFSISTGRVIHQGISSYKEISRGPSI